MPEREHGMYQITYVREERRNAVVLTAQLWYIGEDDQNIIFSARPYAGTQTMPKRTMRTIVKVPDDSGVYIGRDARKVSTPRYVRSQHYRDGR
jgi:hypothetical protein